jgi:hypothetical protein
MRQLRESRPRTRSDALWPAQQLAVQLDGFEFHRTRRDRERDAASDADLELAGHGRRSGTADASA